MLLSGIVRLLTLALVVLPVQAQTELEKQVLPTNLEQQVLEIIKRNPQVILETVANYREQQAREQQQAEWQKNLAQPVVVNIQNAPSLGPAEASLTLVEFSDFGCPFCARANTTVKALVEKYKGDIRLVYLHYPLPSHKQAKPAAQAAWAAGKQGKFFEYHDRLFALNAKLAPNNYEAIARELGLDMVQFNKDRKSPQAVAQINADSKQGQSLGIEGTPTFILNGVVLKGARPLEDFETVIRLIKTVQVPDR
ncbi:thioredoxin domain-containing protein [Candidatus Cyanaurora vandensis]|uniref:DsbA family protein n=1 Tax=Candidatus Cyanaurora vandensis TaxID=2714958 RepID=UPI002580578A|nr:thioredoxin domain-containing protein [Candidatus Cyanaurora vandensis]